MKNKTLRITQLCALFAAFLLGGCNSTINETGETPSNGSTSNRSTSNGNTSNWNISNWKLEPWVKPFERSNLADPIMSINRNPVALAYAKHVSESREGARGADGGAGGGCGCN